MNFIVIIAGCFSSISFSDIPIVTDATSATVSLIGGNVISVPSIISITSNSVTFGA